MDAETQRLAVFHDYGCIVLVVCQAVEPKHIAAVLQLQSAPDLLISVAAIEAVIRAQACHLAPASLKQQVQQQQQQRQLPDVYSIIDVRSNSRSPGVVRDSTHRLTLLCCSCRLCPSFVHSSGSAPECFLQQQDPVFGGLCSVSNKLSARLCMLLNTALKVGKCAVAAATPDQQEGVSRQAMENAIIITKFASCWCSALQSTSETMGDGLAVNLDHTIPVGLMFRALQVGSSGWTSWAATYKVRLAAAATMEQEPLPAAAID